MEGFLADGFQAFVFWAIVALSAGVAIFSDERAPAIAAISFHGFDRRPNLTEIRRQFCLLLHGFFPFKLHSMAKKIAALLFSTRLMAFLFLAFATAMAAGTFIENDYNTATARIIIYNSWWFELIMLLFLVNFIGNMRRYNLLDKKNWATLLLHLAFIFILVGAAITRYISYEGMMPIREGATSNQFYSEKTFLTVFVDGDYKGQLRRRTFEKNLLLSQATDNDFTLKDEFGNTPFCVSYRNFVMGATEKIQESPSGKLFVKMVEAGAGKREEHYLEEGQIVSINNLLFTLNRFTQGAVNITVKDGKTTIQTPFEGMFMRMADKMQGRVEKNATADLMFRSLYNVGGAQFVFPDAPVKGRKILASNNDWKEKHSDDALVVDVSAGGKTQTVTLRGSKGKVGEPVTAKLGGLDFTLLYGSKTYTLPFNVKLDDFIATKYPGSEKSYAAFESRVTVIDGKETSKARIYMNHVLDHGGFRFFQASFDPDEKGTILSVNHDFWGTGVTYTGYFLLFIGLMAIMFTKHSRFGDLKRKLEKVKTKKAGLMALLFLLPFSGFSQHQPIRSKPSDKDIESFISKTAIDEGHAARFGRLVVQDEGGRMKPLNTFSSELLRKVSKSDTYRSLNADQVFLSMQQYREAWLQIPMVNLKKDDDSLMKAIGAEKGQKYASLLDFFDADFNYKLSPFLDAAYRAQIPSQFQKDVIETDRRVNLLNSALSGGMLRIFPIPNDKNNKWVSALELPNVALEGRDSIVRKMLPVYLESLDRAQQSHDYKEADFYLKGLKKFQNKYGYKVMPSAEKIDAEIAYNKYDVFKRLFYLYMTAGVLMLLVTIVNIFFSSKILRYVENFFHIVIGLLFAAHTAGLIARWYISGHAPWSDAYESMIYVAWATMFFTLAFDRKSKLTVASGTFVASMILMIAHWNWMDPAIANLQPVLNSYWLMIHVAVIVASYGPFTLGMVLGVVSLILMMLTTERNKAKMELHLKEITYINEMALTIGLIMLTIGNFLGGQWANESWGRYWGWDPKETWALISIMVYAFVIHARLVPGLRGKWTFNMLSVVAYYSIMMTYFGVNFYLTGLHSYASGDKVVTPSFVYYSAACVAALGALSYWRFKLAKKKARIK
jgi:cytochrome c-type biogenesis protein CcsB